MATRNIQKIYHGVTKTQPNPTTIFYCDFDGDYNPLIGDSYSAFNNLVSLGYRSSVTGKGLISQNGRLVYEVPFSNKGVMTMEFWAEKMPNNTRLLALNNDSNNMLSVTTHSNKLFLGGVSINIDDQKPHNHYRFVINYDKLYVDAYLNGILRGTYSIPSSFKVNKLVLFNYGSDVVTSNTTISDLHICESDLGDCFPTLPTDFINGKAVVLPCFGQQQIKADPMVGQVSRLTVDLKSGWGEIIQGLRRSINNPELLISELSFAQNTKINVKAINKNGTCIIMGALDTDTALARVLDYKVNTTEVKVDDVSRLSVGDTVQFYNESLGTVNSSRNISSINSSTKTITLNSSLTVEGAVYVMETTASSSSPMVKTEDGETVVGTWSGLGTNVAVFTFGNNSNILNLESKKLYITYTLVMPKGNSDFTDVPYELVKAYDDLGVELVPSTNLPIEDNLRGKIKGDMTACPHWMSYTASDKTIYPSDLKGKEDNYIIYQSLGKTVKTYGNNNSGSFSQIVIGFNLIEMVERKLGCEIPSFDKVQWLKDNLSAKAYVDVTCSGSCVSGNTATIKWYDFVVGDYNGETTNTYRSPANSRYGTSNIQNRISPEGFTYVYVYTGKSDGTTSSNISFYDVLLHIELKTNLNKYNYFYTENFKAREGECNPIIIQKHTKEIKRFIPSNKPFSTEVLVFDKSALQLSSRYEGLEPDKYYYKNDMMYATTGGSGSMPVQLSNVYNNVINNIETDSAIKGYDFNNDILWTSQVSGQGNTFVRQLSEDFYNNDLGTLPTVSYNVPSYVVLKPYLYKTTNGELILNLCTSRVTNKGTILDSGSFRNFKITNAPLEK